MHGQQKYQGGDAEQNLMCRCVQKRTAGTLPDSWRQMLALQTLQLSGNGLTGSLPASWQFGMPNITRVTLKFNRLRCVLSWGGKSPPAQLPLPHVCMVAAWHIL